MNYNLFTQKPETEFTVENPKEQFSISPAEAKVLKECSQEAIIYRAIPLSIMFSGSGWWLTKSGYLRSTKYGYHPATIGLGLLGFLIGRYSYAPICLQRVLEVPDGVLRKRFLRAKEFVEHPERFHLDVENSHDQEQQASNLDIDIPSTSSFDTTPYDYYETKQDILDEKPKAYTSYDTLRNQNRQGYSGQMPNQRIPPQQGYPTYPQHSPIVRQAPLQESEPSGRVVRHRTKYGDEME